MSKRHAFSLKDTCLDIYMLVLIVTFITYTFIYINKLLLQIYLVYFYIQANKLSIFTLQNHFQDIIQDVP